MIKLSFSEYMSVNPAEFSLDSTPGKAGPMQGRPNLFDHDYVEKAFSYFKSQTGAPVTLEVDTNDIRWLR